MDKIHERPYYPYSWHQSHDQATVLMMVPYNVQDEDLSVVIDRHHLVITARGTIPIVKGRLYGTVDTASSVWQLEPRGSRLSGGRERTISSASTTSTHSSYALVSDPDISSSFAASLESGQVSDADDTTSPSPALSSPRMVYADENLYPLPPRRKLNPNPAASRSVSPGHARPSATSSFSSLDSVQAPRSGRLLTVHLEKEQSIIWPSLIVGPAPETLSPNVINSTVFNSSEEMEHQYNMDATSLALIALELSDIRKDRDEAFEYFLRSWHQAHVPSATIRLVSHYLPLEATAHLIIQSSEPMDEPEQPSRGTLPYWLKCIGGRKGLARLYLEAGLLHLEGAASTLLSVSYSSLSSIRVPLQSQIGEGGTEAWKRDRDAAAEFFERAQLFDPELDIPTLPAESELELEMPTMQLAPSAPESLHSKESPYDSEPEAPLMRRRRRKPEEGVLDKTQADLDDMGNPWYLYIPGIIGAGTALLVVGIVGALSFSTWSRRNQGS